MTAYTDKRMVDPERDRTIVALRVQERWTLEDIAKEHGISVSRVQQIILRGTESDRAVARRQFCTAFKTKFGGINPTNEAEFAFEYMWKKYGR